MKKVIIIGLASLALSSCGDCNSCNEQHSSINEERFIPKGATLVNEYCENRDQDKNDCGYKRWAKWQFEGECFLSYNLTANNAMLAKVNCNE